MMEELKTISQSDLKELLKARLDYPEKYVGTPLLIWRSDFRDGIQERILTEVFEKYNESRERQDQKWYRSASLDVGLDHSYELTDPMAIDWQDNFYKLGLLVLDPLFMQTIPIDDFKNLNYYYTFINKRKWQNIEMVKGVPLVVYMCNAKKEFETPEKYPDAEQYVFDPDFEEWTNWALKNTKIPKYVIDFIRGDGEKDGIIYRWYNFFSPKSKESEKGCDFPVSWQYIYDQIASLEEETTKEDLYSNFKISSNFSKDIKEDFKQFIKEIK